MGENDAEAARRIEAAAGTGTLDLSGMRLGTVPSGLRSLNELKLLDLSHNNLTELPDWISELTQLRVLSLRHNNLTVLPSSLRRLTGLTFLDVASTGLRELPDWIGDFARLESLSLSSNLLTGLPESFSDLGSLKHLYLHDNELAEVPEPVVRLSGLRALHLADNNLTDLPDALGEWSPDVELYFSRNPLTALPPEVAFAGSLTVRAFLRERSAAATPQWSSKLVVVGQGRAGKTSLLKAVRGEAFDQNEDSTHGLSVDELRLPHPASEHASVTMNLATWDFGGQEIYHATHQFFLTDRSLFVLVWDAQVGWEASKLYYWLDMIKARAPRAPVVLVATHLGPRPAELPLAELHVAYPGMIVESLEADSETREGIAEVVAALAQHASRLPLMGVRWPESWLRTSDAVRADQRDYVTPAVLDEVLAENGITEPSHQEGLRAALHSLGDILAYTEDPELEDIVVLRPQWVTEYISKVLDSPEVRDGSGLFTKRHQAQLWRDLDPGLRQHFVAMMEHFDLSYRTDDGVNSFVVERLPLDPPAYEETWDAIRSDQRELRLRYRLHTVPPGIPTWFIAREHRFTANLHWRTGALLRQTGPDGEHLALIVVDRLARTAELRVRGPYPPDFFAVLKEGFEQTLQRYPGLEINRLVPCPGVLPDGSECTHEFPHEQLKDRLTRTPPREKVECPVDYDDHDVRLLLQGIESPSADHSAELARETKEAVQALQTQIERQDQAQTERELDLLQELRLAKAQRFAIAAEQQRGALAVWRGQNYHASCPTLLSVTRVQRRRALGLLPGAVLQLRLYCEAPGAWHPAPGHEPYEVRATSQKLAEVMPYARTVLKVLRYAVPVAGAILDVAADDLNKQLKDDILLMKSLVEAAQSAADQDLPFVDSNTFRLAERHSEFRTMYALLKKLDPDRRWAGLNKVVTPEGDTLWLCDHHARPFTPARPQLPPTPPPPPALPSP